MILFIFRSSEYWILHHYLTVNFYLARVQVILANDLIKLNDERYLPINLNSHWLQPFHWCAQILIELLLLIGYNLIHDEMVSHYWNSLIVIIQYLYYRFNCSNLNLYIACLIVHHFQCWNHNYYIFMFCKYCSDFLITNPIWLQFCHLIGRYDFVIKFLNFINHWCFN